MTHDTSADAGTFMGWVPAEHLDEVAPECRVLPSDWLRTAAGGCQSHADFLLDGFGAATPRPVAAGERVVFAGLTEYPPIRVVWHAPGRWEVLTTVPAAATCFVLSEDPDGGLFATTLAAFMGNVTLQDLLEPGEELVIDGYHWRDETFVLRTFGPGDGAFVLVEEPAHA